VSGVRTAPIDSPSAWRGADLARSDEWVHVLTPPERDDLRRGLERARATGKPMSEISREDFPLPVLEPVAARWLGELQTGRGFLNVRGIPFADAEEAAWMHWGIGLQLGTAVSQNAAGDLLGHVRDTGADPEDTSVRLYKTRVELGFHSDGSDLVGLLCIRPGRSGGANRLVSTATLYNEILRRRPDLVPLLFEPFYWDRNEEQAPGEDPFFALPICRRAGDGLAFFYIGWSIRKAQRHAAVPRLSHEQTELLDLVDAIAEDPSLHIEMRLEPGEVNYLKNNAVLHARTAFEDDPDPAKKRHMVRLWLSAHGDWADGDEFVRQGIPRKAGVQSDAEAIHASSDADAH